MGALDLFLVILARRILCARARGVGTVMPRIRPVFLVHLKGGFACGFAGLPRSSITSVTVGGGDVTGHGITSGIVGGITSGIVRRRRELRRNNRIRIE